jgi:hypothetical protein
VASSIPTYREMQRALLVKSPKRALPVVSGAPATKWQAADRMVKALTGAFMENRRRKEEDAGIGEARSVIDAYYGSGLEEYKPVLPGASSDELLQTVADPTFSAEDRAGAGSNFIQDQELPPVASPMNDKWTGVQDAMDKGFHVSPQDQAELARLQELAVILSREDSAARAADDLAARQTHLGEERARMIAQNAADLPGAQAELDALNEAGEGFRPLTPEELAARNKEGLAEWETANPTGMDAVIDLDPQSSRGKQMRNALMGQGRESSQAIAAARLLREQELEDRILSQEELDQKIAIAQAGADIKPATQPEIESSGYANRMLHAIDIFDAPGVIEAGMEPGQKLLSNVPFFGNAMVSKEMQRFDQAGRNFINAVLRRESGAAISDSEFDNAYAQYLPVYGDDALVLADKRQNMQDQIDMMIQSAGKAYNPPPPEPPAPMDGAVYNGLMGGKHFWKIPSAEGVPVDPDNPKTYTVVVSTEEG